MGLIVNTDLISLYKFYNTMKYYGNFSFQELDLMLPMEREIFYSLLKETIKEDVKNKEKLSNQKI